MKKLLLGAVALAMLTGAYAFARTTDSVKTVNVRQPGTLYKALPVKAMPKSKRLKINGPLNNDDIIYLRQICGADSLGNPTTAYVTDIDLTGVTFDTADTGHFAIFGTKKRVKYGIGAARVMPPCMFYRTSIERITLPSQIDSIGAFALSGTRLTHLDIPADVAMAPNAVTVDSGLVSLKLGRLDRFHKLSEMDLPAIRHITFRDIDYVPGGTFADMPDLETVTFDGRIGHIDGYQFCNDPRLRTVTFNGPILTTGGAQVAENCPELQSMTFNAMVGALGLTDFVNCPKIDSITDNSSFNAADYKRLVDYQIRQFNGNGFLKKIALMGATEMEATGRANGCDADADRLMAAYEQFRDPDLLKSKLQILKESAPYATEPDTAVTFTYQAATDSALTATRLNFNLDSIAGTGDDVSRIKNLTYWIHDLVPHDGSSAWPKCPLTIKDLAKVCKDENRGVNCRLMAIMLTEALLAEGIPARYVTCQSKAYDEDSDCHVICIAWSRQLGKWIWADPTFAAFVTDENGTPLHPGEVRQRLIDDAPLVLNDDANWNHKSSQTKEHYLDEYMAKNLYVIQARMRQEYQPEGQGAKRCPHITLVPTSFKYYEGEATTNDDKAFWTAPAAR